MALLERASHLRTVAAHLADAAAGHGRLVFVGGEAGVGKSTFVRAVLDAAGEGARTASGGCEGSSTPAPLGPLLDLLPHLPADVWPPGAPRHEVFTRLVAALRAPPTPQPYLLVVEEAHWADEATLDLLRHLSRRIHTCRALVLVTYRPEDLGDDHGLRLLMGDAGPAAGVRRLDVAALSPAGVAALVLEQPGGVEADGDVQRLHVVTGGNPFFVTEVLAAGGPELPTTVRDAVLARIARLTEPARDAVEVAAIAGPRVELGLLEALLGTGITAVDEALARDVLRLRGGVVTFRHELARAVVEARVPPRAAACPHRHPAGGGRPAEPDRLRVLPHRPDRGGPGRPPRGAGAAARARGPRRRR